MPQITELSSEDRVEAYQHLKQAIYYLVCVWDELHGVENALHIDIEVGAISCSAAGCRNAEDAFLISDECLEELIKEIEVGTTNWAQRTSKLSELPVFPCAAERAPDSE